MIMQPKERTVLVLLSFMWKGEPTTVGKKMVLPNDFAHEMRHSGKVEFTDSDPVPLKTEPDQPPNALPVERVVAKGKGDSKNV